MKSIPAEHPFLGYKLYKVWHAKEGRWYAQLVRGPGDRTTISFARYVMSVHLKRKLLPSEHVDHVNEDKSNDAISNLQILSGADNNKKHTRLSGKSTELVSLICHVCGAAFQRPPRNVNHKLAKGKRISCSRACGYIASRKESRVGN